ncbi:MAG TPA: hypothetical protein VG621_01315 [Candidatus Paceibacterota bacterium]|nr:hypothetical protein [Candidatus Paceibacterota bacterium]
MNFEQDPFGDNDRAKEQDKDRENGGYGGDYYDENEHRAGQEKYDLATGEAFRNDADIEAPEANIVALHEHTQDPLTDLETDPAEKWLLENDPEYLGKGKWKEKKPAA